MFLFQAQPVPFFQYAPPFGPFSLTPQYITQAVQSVTPQTYLTVLKPLLDAIQNLGDEQKAGFGDILKFRHPKPISK